MKPAARMATTASILLVDDNTARRRERAIVLATHGYEVQCAASLADAQLQCRANEPDLLLIGVTQVARARSAPDQGFIGNAQHAVGFLLNDGQELCAVHFDGRLLLPREGADDFVSRVAMLLNRRATAIALASFGKSQ